LGIFHSSIFYVLWNLLNVQSITTNCRLIISLFNLQSVSLCNNLSQWESTMACSRSQWEATLFNSKLRPAMLLTLKARPPTSRKLSPLLISS